MFLLTDEVQGVLAGTTERASLGDPSEGGRRTDPGTSVGRGDWEVPVRSE